MFEKRQVEGLREERVDGISGWRMRESILFHLLISQISTHATMSGDTWERAFLSAVGLMIQSVSQYVQSTESW